MARDPAKSPRARLFVALDLPARARAAIGRWGEEELKDPALRRVEEESLHVTLAFLGATPEEEIDRLAKILRQVDAPSPRMELRDPVPRPERGRPRLFALPVESSGAVEIQASLAERLAAASFFKPEKRPFWPHVTVARVRSGGRASRRPMRVAEPPGKLPCKLREQVFDAVRLTLYRSELQSRGARYAQLVQIELPRGRQ
jgi:RNA 2',3'-cyclic 3'-phosphodiesterase